MPRRKSELPIRSESAYYFRDLFGASKKCRCPSDQPRGKLRARWFSARRCGFLQAYPHPRWLNNPRISNRAPVRPQAQSMQQPLQRLLPRASSRPPFARSKAKIQARCTVIIGGATAVMCAISRAIISRSRQIIASINPTAIARPMMTYNVIGGQTATQQNPTADC
jgi:hypothetical protein